MGQSPPSQAYSSDSEDGLPFLQGTAHFGLKSPSPEIYCRQPTKIARKGDILLSVRAPVGKLNLADQDFGIGRGLCAIRPRAGWNARFAWWALHEAREQLALVSTGSTYSAVATADVANLRIVTTALASQRKIARYLDRQTAQLDELMEVQERVIGLLAEKRRALITRAVTRGLPSRAPFRNSGIQWLGDIPAHWQIQRLKHLGYAIIGLTFDPADTVTDGSGVLVLRAGNIHEQKIVLHDRLYVSTEIPDPLRTKVHDLLICSRSGTSELVGKNALIDDDTAGMTFGAFMTVFRSPYNEYLFYVLNSPLLDYQAGAFRTSTINQLTVETLTSMKVPVPPLPEQKSIVDHLRERTSAIDQLVNVALRSLALLKERRTALIAAAMRGQINPQRLR